MAREAGMYAAGGMLIGIAQLVDAVFLFVNEGRVNIVNVAVSYAEIAWCAVSLVVIVVSRAVPVRLLAGAFVGYTAATTLYGQLATIESIPAWLAVVAGLFGFAYAVGSGYVARRG
jgi:hypothetical protein